MIRDMTELWRNAVRVPLNGLTASDGFSPNEASTAAQYVAEADIVVGFDVMTRRLFLLHGSEMALAWLNSRPGLPDLHVVVVELDEDDPQDLATLQGIVTALHGHHDYRPGAGFFGEPTELDEPVIRQAVRDGPVLWFGGNIISIVATVLEGVVPPRNMVSHPHVKPIAWFYPAEYQEALRSLGASACAGPEGCVERYLRRAQSMRIGIRPELAPVSWDQYVQTSGMPRRLAKTIRRCRPPALADMGALHGSYTGVSRSDWVALEILDDLGDWMPLTKRRLDQTEDLLAALADPESPSSLP